MTGSKFFGAVSAHPNLRWAKRFLVNVIVVAVLVGVSGCETTGTSGTTAGSSYQSSPKYSIFFDQGDHLKKLIAGENYGEAAELYVKEKEFFLKKQNKFAGDLRTLAEELNSSFAPDLRSAANELEAVAVPVPRDEWAHLRVQLARTKKLLERYDRYAFLRERDYRSPLVARLETAHLTVAGNVRQEASSAFVEFDHFADESFFDAYPVELDGVAFLQDHAEAWTDRVNDANAEQLTYVHEIYGNLLSEKQAAELGRLYFLAMLGTDSKEQKPTFRELLQAIRAAREANMPLDEIPGAEIALIEVTSRTLLKEGQIEFPVALNVDLPIRAEKADLDETFNSPIAQNADILILLDVAAARTTRKIVAYDKVSSEFRSGTRTLPNPAYNRLQNEVNTLSMEYQRASMNMASVNAQYCYGVECFGKLIAQIAVAAQESEAKKNVGEAMARLNSTSMTIEKPVYSPYTFNKVTIEASKEATVNYYVIDRIANEFIRDTFDARQTETFVVGYNVHEREKNRYSILAGTNKEQDVVSFEEEPIEVNLSSILEQFTAEGANIRPLPGLAEIRDEVVIDKNKALAAYRERQYEAVPKDDSRFESVVVVFHPGGSLGTGFFVRDDLVLTNYHVIEGGRYVEMKMFDGQETFGKVIASDIRLDLALIKVQTRGTPVTIFTGRTLPLGEPVEAVGHPKGLEFTITRGVISALREIESRYMQGGKTIRFIQTDAAISPGNSGGPLFFGDKVVGVNTQKLAATELEGLSFAIHYSEILDFLESNDVVIRAGM
ncbi:MAG: serine protease [Proteobacteria bacterium]|nr:serine protease [Pseudomonadota bacterium]